jgi:hypothetical protein
MPPDEALCCPTLLCDACGDAIDTARPGIIARRGATVRALDGVADLREHPHRAARLAAVPRPPVRVRARSITAGLLLLVLHLSDEGLRDSA